MTEQEDLQGLTTADLSDAAIPNHSQEASKDLNSGSPFSRDNRQQILAHESSPARCPTSKLSETNGKQERQPLKRLPLLYATNYCLYEINL